MREWVSKRPNRVFYAVVSTFFAVPTVALNSVIVVTAAVIMVI